jgi:hypothetical protein
MHRETRTGTDKLGEPERWNVYRVTCACGWRTNWYRHYGRLSAKAQQHAFNGQIGWDV